MELFVAVALALMITTATARYAVWFECDPNHAVAFVAATAATVVITIAVALGGCDPLNGLVLIGGVVSALVADAAQYKTGLVAKAPAATLAAVALLAPHVTHNRGPLYAAALGVFILAAGAWRDAAWLARTSQPSCGRS